jgi:hypothetical protein
MNLIIMCSGCGGVFRVMEADPLLGDCVQLIGTDSEWWPNKYVCPKCGAQATGADEMDTPRSIQTSNIVDLTAIEAFSAFSGFGLPDERPSSVENLTEVLRSSSVKAVVGRNVPNTDRCVVERIDLANGVKIYFGASVHGAVVYRVVHPVSYAERVLEEDVRGRNL